MYDLAIPALKLGYYLICNSPFSGSQWSVQEVKVPHIQRFATIVQLDVSQNHIYPNKSIIIAFHYVCSSQVLDLQDDKSSRHEVHE